MNHTAALEDPSVEDTGTSCCRSLLTCLQGHPQICALHSGGKMNTKLQLDEPAPCCCCCFTQGGSP